MPAGEANDIYGDWFTDIVGTVVSTTRRVCDSSVDPLCGLRVEPTSMWIRPLYRVRVYVPQWLPRVHFALVPLVDSLIWPPYVRIFAESDVYWCNRNCICLMYLQFCVEMR